MKHRRRSLGDCNQHYPPQMIPIPEEWIQPKKHKWNLEEWYKKQSKEQKGRDKQNRNTKIE